MYCHIGKKVCFVAHPRTASTATGKVLLTLDFEQMINHHGFKPEVLNPSWTIFATVRNPFDLLVSWYWHKRREQKSFQEWLPIFLKESNEYLDKGLFFALPHCTHVLRYENLQNDFDQVMVEAGFPPTEIPKHNVSIRRDDRPVFEYYDSKLINLMKAHFGDEIRQHSYEVPQ